MKLRQFAVRAFSVAAVAVTACVGVGGVATAEPVDALRYGPFGEFIFLGQPGGNCNGTVHVNPQTDAAQPGKVRLRLTPSGFEGPNPSCDVEFLAVPMVPRFDGTGIDGSGQVKVPVSFPRGSHEPVDIDITAGSGLNTVNLQVAGGGSVGSFVGYYMMVP